jgi:hypothetical protein
MKTLMRGHGPKEEEKNNEGQTDREKRRRRKRIFSLACMNAGRTRDSSYMRRKRGRNKEDLATRRLFDMGSEMDAMEIVEICRNMQMNGVRDARKHPSEHEQARIRGHRHDRQKMYVKCGEGRRLAKQPL